MNDDLITLDALSRKDLYVFARRAFRELKPGAFEDAEYLRLLASRLEDVGSGNNLRLVINMPPRMLKSFFATVCFPAWLIGHNPKIRLMIASHTIRLASEHLGDIRKLLKTEFYRRIFPATRIGVRDNETVVETTAGGRVLAVSFEAAPTGFGGDGVIVDDPIKADGVIPREELETCDQFFRDALLTRLDSQERGFVIVVMQRVANHDLAGKLIERGGYELLSLPLVAVEAECISYGGDKLFVRSPGQLLNPARISQRKLGELKQHIIDSVFAAQFQQRPLIGSGSYVKRDWLMFIDTPLAEPSMTVQAWDTATATSESASYTVCLTWRIGGKQFELVDVYRERLNADGIVAVANGLTDRFKPRVVLVEEANVGYTVIHVLRQRPGLAIESIRPAGTKVQRFEPCRPAFQTGMVLLPRSAPWLNDYVEEILAFPDGRFDDQVDATSLFLTWALPRVTGQVNDPNFRLNVPYLSRGSAGGPRTVAIGRGIHSTRDFLHGGGWPPRRR